MSIDALGRERKTRCIHGHPFDGTEKWSTNWKGYKCRVCRECSRIRMQRKREKPDFKAFEAAKMRQWRIDNPEAHKAATKRAYEKRNKWIQSFKTQCKHCSESRFPCLDFHHRDSGQKIAAIAQVRHWSHERLKAEIEKCDIVCANCHRWLHWQEHQ